VFYQRNWLRRSARRYRANPASSVNFARIFDLEPGSHIVRFSLPWRQRIDRDTRTGLINPYPARQAASIVALAAFNVAWVSRAILPFAIKLRSLAFRVVVE